MKGNAAEQIAFPGGSAVVIGWNCLDFRYLDMGSRGSWLGWETLSLPLTIRVLDLLIGPFMNEFNMYSIMYKTLTRHLAHHLAHSMLCCSPFGKDRHSAINVKAEIFLKSAHGCDCG